MYFQVIALENSGTSGCLSALFSCLCLYENMIMVTWQISCYLFSSNWKNKCIGLVQGFLPVEWCFLAMQLARAKGFGGFQGAHKMILPMQHNSCLSWAPSACQTGWFPLPIEIRAWRYSDRPAPLCPCGGTEWLFSLAGALHCPLCRPILNWGEREGTRCCWRFAFMAIQLARTVSHLPSAYCLLCSTAVHCCRT